MHSFTIVDLGQTAARISGELDAHTAPLLAARLDRVDWTSPPVFWLDMSGCTFMDSAGLRVLIVAHQAADLAGGRLILLDPTAPVLRVIDVTGLSGELNVEPRD